MIDVLLTDKERKAIAEKIFNDGYFSQAKMDEAIESENKAQCRKFLGVLKEPCKEREHYLNANAFNDGYHMSRKKCPKCMAEIEEAIQVTTIRLNTLEELNQAKLNKQSVVVPSHRAWNKPKPAAFLMELSGTLLILLFKTGIYIYNKDNRNIVCTFTLCEAYYKCKKTQRDLNLCQPKRT